LTFRFAAYVTVFFSGIMLSILTLVAGVVLLVEGKLVSQVSFLAPFTPIFGLAGGFFLGAGIFGLTLIMFALLKKEKTASVEKVKVQSEIQS
jgi:hypothetical protein